MKIVKSMLVAAFIATFLIGCQSPEQKQIDAQENLDKAKSDVNKASQDSLNVAQKDSSNTYFGVKNEWEKQINNNDKNIAELKANAAKDKKVGTDDYLYKLSELDRRNNDLTTTIRNYKYSDNDWVSCKRSINNDMSDLIVSIKNAK
jgi:hypothetical protein